MEQVTSAAVAAGERIARLLSSGQASAREQNFDRRIAVMLRLLEGIEEDDIYHELDRTDAPMHWAEVGAARRELARIRRVLAGLQARGVMLLPDPSASGQTVCAIR